MSSEQAKSEADEIVKSLLAKGLDYSSRVGEIADMFDNILWRGDWTAVLEASEGCPALLFIQEDEYDQSMPDDEKPDWDTMLAFDGGHYIFPA